MKTVKELVTLAVVMVMAVTFGIGCAENDGSGKSSDPIGPGPDTGLVLNWTYDENASNLVWDSDVLTPWLGEDGVWRMLVEGAMNAVVRGINAITPGFDPAYVAIGGDAVNPTCNNPFNPACRIDISGNCNAGVCSASVNLPIGSWNSIWFWYDGQVRVDHISLTAAGQTWQLVNYGTLSADTWPVTSPLHQAWPAACVRVDRPTPTTIVVNRDVANNPRCQEILYVLELYATGDSSVNVLDDKFIPWNGLQANEGDMKIKTTLLPPTVQAGSTLFPRVLWNASATPAPAYTHRFASVTSGMSHWLAFYSHDRGDFAPPGALAPIHGGVSIRTYRYGAGWAIPTTPNCTTELQNMQNLYEIDPLLLPFYVLQMQGVNTTSNCIIQGVDTRSQIFGFAN